MICIGCVSGRDNAYLSTGEDYGFKPQRYTIGCEYHNLDYKVVDRIIGILGDEYEGKFSSYQDEYYWKSVQCAPIGKGAFDIKVKTRPAKNARFDDANKKWPEHITIYIQQEGRDYLSPLKMTHRVRVKKFLIELTE